MHSLKMGKKDYTGSVLRSARVKVGESYTGSHEAHGNHSIKETMHDIQNVEISEYCVYVHKGKFSKERRRWVHKEEENPRLTTL